MNLVVKWKIFEKRMRNYRGGRLVNGAAGELRGALADITWRKTDKRSTH